MNITAAAHPIIVKRDVDGNWRHPNLPVFSHGEEAHFDIWARVQGLQAHTVKERLAGDDFTEWTPDAPDGEGWFTLEVRKLGNIASWTWAKKVTP